jgi:uncharacterized membrane protein
MNATLTAPPTSRLAGRLAWIDWLRGLACLVMFQTHCYDAWLGGAARDGRFLKASQTLGTLPAPLFLFLAGMSFALVAAKLIRKNLSAAEITRKMALRGLEIFAFGLLFRLQEFLIAWGWAPKSDLLRVDILNMIGLSMILMAVTCGSVFALIGRPATSAVVIASGAIIAAIAFVTPLIYTSWRPTWLPWWLESYVDGCHNLGSPQPWLFPLFPWSAFAFAGLACGFLLFSNAQTQAQVTRTLSIFGIVGAAAIVAAYVFDHSRFQLYSTYDYWHTSPNFLMMRIGMLMLVAFVGYAWCRWGFGAWAFSPLIQLGQTSLLVYWVHIEFVYGRFSLLPKRAGSIATASRGLLEIFIFMLILSLLRTRIDWKNLGLRKLSTKITTRTQPA